MLQSNFIEIALWHGCSPVNLLHIFRTPFPRNTSGWLLLYRAMYKTRNRGTGNGMRRTRGMNGGNVLFRGMSSNIPGNIVKHSGQCRQTFRGMSSNIPGNVAKHSGECHQTFRGMSPNTPGNVVKHSGERRQTFQEMLPIFGVKGRVAFRILSNIHDGALLQK